MSEAAKVTAIDAIQDFRAALVEFGEDATDALCSAEAEIRRMGDWTEDQLKNWQVEVRAGEEQVFQAKTELTRRKMMQFGDRPVDTTDQELALRRAKARLEHAEDQVEKTREWLRAWPKAVSEYRGPSGQLKALLEGDLPRATALLSRKIAALQAYADGSSGLPSSAPAEASPEQPLEEKTPENSPQERPVA
jgi:hypothetical protein